VPALASICASRRDSASRVSGSLLAPAGAGAFARQLAALTPPYVSPVTTRQAALASRALAWASLCAASLPARKCGAMMSTLSASQPRSSMRLTTSGPVIEIPVSANRTMPALVGVEAREPLRIENERQQFGRAAAAGLLVGAVWNGDSGLPAVVLYNGVADLGIVRDELLVLLL
jgi:hypothetical protein